MDHRKKPCNCVRECPCYPKCDEMMEQNQMPGRSGMWHAQPDMVSAPWQNVRMGMNMEEEDEKDWMMMKEMYPEMAKIIQSQVEMACDKMEYEGSPMFDAVPDKTRIRSMTQEIMQQIGNAISPEQVEEEADLYTMNREPCRNCRPNQNFLGDFVEVMLHHEMFRRRCRHRRCRRW